MMRTRKKQLENGMTEDDLGGLAMRLWERIMYPTAELEQNPLPDSGFLAVAGTIINIEFSSDVTVKTTTVKELADTLRKAYCEANNVPHAEPTDVEQKAWKAVARLVAYAVQTETSQEAGQEYDRLLNESRAT